MLAVIAVPIILFTAFAIIKFFSSEQSGTPSDYKNDNYQVPPANTVPPPYPKPTTFEQAKTWMESNAIYKQSVPVPVRCEVGTINLQTATKAELEKHFNEFTACLMRVFGPSLEAAGFTPVRPTVTVYTSKIQTACGSVPMKNAVYCMADQQVYYAKDLPAIIPSELRNSKFIVESVMAHEFSHAIQARTGILYSEMAWQTKVTKEQALELSRRTEVQADCWAGQFIQSVSQSAGLTASDQNNIGKLFYSIGDDILTNNPNTVGNHGRGNTRRSWYQTGLTQTSMGSCNSYTAPASKVT